MANELKMPFADGTTIVVIVRDKDGQVANLDTEALEAWNGAHVANYEVAMNTAGGNLYLGDFPDWLPAGTYTLEALAAGVLIGAAEAYWDGINLIYSDFSRLQGLGVANITENSVNIDTGNVLGIITRDSIPIAGALVVIYADADVEENTPLQWGLSRGDGGFTVAVNAGATYRVQVVVNGEFRCVQRVTV
jgi:hypothetical protein